MTIIVKTGRCGSGKTLHCMSMIEQFLREGRSVYTNIRGISINGVVRVMDDFEWWTMPLSAVLILDEVQNSIYYQKDHWRRLNDQEKAHRAKILSRLNTHRHTFSVDNGDEFDQAGDYTLIFMTQDCTALDTNLRIAEVHQHHHRPKKLKYVYIYEWDRYQGHPDAKTNKLMATRTKFIFDRYKYLYKYYDSISSASADRAKLPFSILLVCFLPIVLIGYGLKGIFIDDSLRTTGKTHQKTDADVATAQLASTAPAQAVELDKVDTAPYISMCSATYPPKSGGCICRDGGQVLMLDTNQCYIFAGNPKLWSVRERQNQTFADAAIARNATSDSTASATTANLDIVGSGQSMVGGSF